MLRAFVLAALLVVPSVAHAVPAQPTLGHVWLTAPACGWSALLRGSPEEPAHYAPACAGLTVLAELAAGETVRLETTLSQFADPFTTLAAAWDSPKTRVSTDVRETAGGVERIPLTSPTGASHLWLSLMAHFDPILMDSTTGVLADGTPVRIDTFDVARGVGFHFDLDYPFVDPVLAHAPEPSTLFLVGSAMALIGWRLRRGA